jgi:hypothetical protein
MPSFPYAQASVREIPKTAAFEAAYFRYGLVVATGIVAVDSPHQHSREKHDQKLKIY